MASDNAPRSICDDAAGFQSAATQMDLEMVGARSPSSNHLNVDFRTLLPQVLPHAIAWAEVQAHHVASHGAPLPAMVQEIARRVGVRRPELIRTMLVPQLPIPEEPSLRQAAIETGLLGREMVGLTLGYSIILVVGHDTLRLLSHECRHVHQYELFGSIANFLSVYLQQIADFGYQCAPLEADARAHEIFSATRVLPDENWLG